MDRNNVRNRAAIEQVGNAEIYERLFQLNQHCSAVMATLNALLANGAVNKQDAEYYGLMVEEVRASASQCVVEQLDEREVRFAARASKSRLKLEKKLFGL